MYSYLIKTYCFICINFSDVLFVCFMNRSLFIFSWYKVKFYFVVSSFSKKKMKNNNTHFFCVSSSKSALNCFSLSALTILRFDYLQPRMQYRVRLYTVSLNSYRFMLFLIGILNTDVCSWNFPSLFSVHNLKS